MTMCECAALRRKCDRLQAKLARIEAAREPEALALRVRQVDPLTWHVPSDTADGGYRVVIYMPRVERYSCDCESNVHRGDCRHVAATSIFNQGRATANQEQLQIQEQIQ